jgi:predicted nuclease of restriction endonuclease-like RecB superfamily
LLTADLVHVRRRGDRLAVVPITEAERPRALELARSAIALVRAHVGLTRGALQEAWSHVPVSPGESKLARGLFKLAVDTCDFDEALGDEASKLRLEIFARAAALRRSGSAPPDRREVLSELAQARGTTIESLDDALYGDLPTAHRLREAKLPTPEGLLAQHALSSHQAVLLRAVRVEATVHCTSPIGYRTLFNRLKFHQLLHDITKLERNRGYAVTIDGPFSIFEQTTKYGLKLALALPAIMACDSWAVRADLRWGKERRPLVYALRGQHADLPAPGTSLSADTANLLAEFRQVDSPWQAEATEAILDLPGVGLCVPDLEFVHKQTGRRIFLEVLGFWSRSAVWKRIELVQAGLPFSVVFAVSKHLRVSEEALSDDVPAALYVYARAINARAILGRLDDIAARPHGS